MACISVGLFALTAFSACATTANIVEVYTGLDAPDGKGETRRRELFYTDTNEIHCIARAGIGRANATIEGYIHQIRRYNFDTNEFDEVNRYIGFVEIKPEPSKDPIYIDLKLGRVDADGKPSDDAPFIAGSYVCEVALDGVIERTAPFNIDIAPCPPASLVPGGPCFGFYPHGQNCPKYGERADAIPSCRCDRKEGWQCDPG